ncbi:MAG: lipoate--protein ligase [Bacteroidia bacterium]|nr:lipoate--protein ligase [Bacteroidia bacterium]
MKKIQIKISNSNSVALNLALEEYLVTSLKEDILLFYINTNAVVIGKHQNPWKEVNLTSAKTNNIEVARRLSGGGTVYHDLGNINFSFIRNKEEDFVNFREHIEAISQALRNLNVENHISPRNDIFIGEYKISGNAEHVNNSKKRIIHHGTLLYDSNIEQLSKNIKPEPIQIKTHAVNSVRSPVKNIRSEGDLGDTEAFLTQLISQITNVIEVESKSIIDPKLISEVSTLALEKYSQWDWTFGHTPQFVFTNENGVNFKIRKGKVIECENAAMIGLRSDEVIK